MSARQGELIEAIEAAERRATDARELAIARLEVAAERREQGWVERALEAVREHARAHPTFLAEDVRADFPEPEDLDGRVWGAVMRRAQAEGICEAVGYAPSNSSNRSPKVHWSATRAMRVS